MPESGRRRRTSVRTLQCDRALFSLSALRRCGFPEGIRRWVRILVLVVAVGWGAGCERPAKRTVESKEFDAGPKSEPAFAGEVAALAAELEVTQQAVLKLAEEKRDSARRINELSRRVAALAEELRATQAALTSVTKALDVQQTRDGETSIEVAARTERENRAQDARLAIWKLSLIPDLQDAGESVEIIVRHSLPGGAIVDAFRRTEVVKERLVKSSYQNPLDREPRYEMQRYVEMERESFPDAIYIHGLSGVVGESKRSVTIFPAGHYDYAAGDGTVRRLRRFAMDAPEAAALIVAP